jgi:predicted permease
MHTINTLAPVFLLIALGGVLMKTRFLSAELVTGLNRLVYWVGLPALLFYKIAIADYDFHTAGKTFLVVFLCMFASIIAGCIVAYLLKVPAVSVGTFVQGAYRGNLLYIGLPIIIYSFHGAQNAEQMQNTAAIVLGFIVPFYNIVAVIVLLASQHKIDRHIFAKIFSSVLTNPLFIACVAGIIYSALSLKIPLAGARTIEAVGQIALPLALLAIGATLAYSRVSGRKSFAFVASIIKVALTPLIGFAIAILIGLGSGETRIALIYLACPTAVLSFIMAENLGGDGKLAAAIVFISALLSVVSLAVVVAFF